MISRNFSQRVFQPALRKADLPLATYHSLRHSFVSLLVSQGANIKMISNLCGHSSTQMTLNVYAGLFPGETKAAINKLDEVINRKAEETSRSL
ncbi:MAG: hypothetical protein A2W01_12390 [Candidatus Solincola sediminis]|nr:MAG: hypothetical protein A2W01_12390 [Candidatus Solincola sediminis]